MNKKKEEFMTPCVARNSLMGNPVSLSEVYSGQDKINEVICGLIGKIYQFDYEKEGLDERGLSLGPVHFIHPNDLDLRCSFNLKKDVEHESMPTKNWGANVKNKKGAWIPDEVTYTVKQLSDSGIFTFDCPEQMKVKTKLFCNGNRSCNKNLRMVQECGPEKSLAECQDWSLQQALDWAAEQAKTNPDSYRYSIETPEGTVFSESPTTPLSADMILDYLQQLQQNETQKDIRTTERSR